MTNNCRQSPYQNSTRRQLNATLFAVRLGNRRRRRPNRNKNIERNTRKRLIPCLENFQEEKLCSNKRSEIQNPFNKKQLPRLARTSLPKKIMRPIRVRHAWKESGGRVQGRTYTTLLSAPVVFQKLLPPAPPGVPCGACYQKKKRRTKIMHETRERSRNPAGMRAGEKKLRRSPLLLRKALERSLRSGLFAKNG